MNSAYFPDDDQEPEFPSPRELSDGIEIPDSYREMLADYTFQDSSGTCWEWDATIEAWYEIPLGLVDQDTMLTSDNFPVCEFANTKSKNSTIHIHQPKTYQGLIETYEYCTDCGVKLP